jgi:hypothetical protein
VTAVDRIYEASTDLGVTWERIDPQERSPLLAYLADRQADEVYDDGYGNLYRWRAAD